MHDELEEPSDDVLEVMRAGMRDERAIDGRAHAIAKSTLHAGSLRATVGPWTGAELRTAYSPVSSANERSRHRSACSYYTAAMRTGGSTRRAARGSTFHRDRKS